jgi:hypothetical protein
MALTPRQQRFAELVAAGKSQAKAAEAVGVAPRTARYWLHDQPELREHIDILSEEIQRDAVSMLGGLLVRAVRTLGRMMLEQKPDQIQLSAARGVIADFPALKSYVDLEARIAELERKAQADEE